MGLSMSRFVAAPSPPSEKHSTRAPSAVHAPSSHRVGQIYAVRTTEDKQKWLALGIIIRPDREPASFAFHGANEETSAQIGWRYVTSALGIFNHPHHQYDPRFMTVPCMDGSEFKQMSCWCKTVWWFRKGLAIFQNAQFLGRIEDDVQLPHSMLALGCWFPLGVASSTSSLHPPHHQPVHQHQHPVGCGYVRMWWRWWRMV